VNAAASGSSLISTTVIALRRLGRAIAACFAQTRICKSDACVSVRAVRAAQSAQHLHPKSKSEILLREWLFPEQLAQYEAMGAFEVIGSKTGKRYRIQEGRQQNVYELDGKGRRIRGWCFMPKGNLAMGDVMLAQKIALETDEEWAIKVAALFWAERGCARDGNSLTAIH
jgi:hypothetical protein